MKPLTTEGTLCAVKAACTVRDEGKPGDDIKRLPIIIRHRDPAIYHAVDIRAFYGGISIMNIPFHLMSLETKVQVIIAYADMALVAVWCFLRVAVPLLIVAVAILAILSRRRQKSR